ncbi:MAG: capsule assembly Wzi family protein [Longimicrobiales bacterium]
MAAPNAHAQVVQDVPRAVLDTAGLPSLRQPSPFLPGSHWAVAAVRRLHAVGLVPQTLEPSAARTPRVVEVAGAFAFAMRHAEDEATRILAGRWLELLQREIGINTFTDATASAEYTGHPFMNGTAMAGAMQLDGRAGTGTGYDENPPAPWTGSILLQDEVHPLIGVSAHGALGSRVGFHVDVAAVGTESIAVPSAHAVVDAGFVGFWAGRRQIAFGPGWSGTIALGDGHEFTGAGMYFAEGARLPWILRYLGPIRFEGFVSRVDNGDGVGVTDPVFGAARLSSNLHPRFSLGATRATMFGGENALPFTWTRFRQMLLGDPSTEDGGAWSNEVFAWDLRWRPPIGRLPLLLYAELGFDDASGAYHRTPGVIAGIDIGMVPGLPQLGVGVERIYFSAASFKNGIWYRNYALNGGWTNDRRPLGHPIGGHGKGWYAHASLDLLDARLRLQSAAFRYDRGSENLYAPERVGRAYGGSLDAAWRVAPRLEMTVGATLEDGADWQESMAELRLRYIF